MLWGITPQQISSKNVTSQSCMNRPWCVWMHHTAMRLPKASSPATGLKHTRTSARAYHQNNIILIISNNNNTWKRNKRSQQPKNNKSFMAGCGFPVSLFAFLPNFFLQNSLNSKQHHVKMVLNLHLFARLSYLRTIGLQLWTGTGQCPVSNCYFQCYIVNQNNVKTQAGSNGLCVRLWFEVRC